MPFLMTVDKARFRTFVEPDAVLDVSAELVIEGSGYAATKAKITIAGKPICDAELRFRLMPFPADMRDPDGEPHRGDRPRPGAELT